MLVYILKSIACLAILFVFYKIFLEKENMHVFKRFYLLGALVFSMIIPSLVFTEYVMVEPEPIVTVSTPFVIPQTTATDDFINVQPALEADVLDIEPVLWGVYFLGLLFFGLKFIRNLFQIFRRIRKNPKQKLSRFTQVLLQEKITPHTFFSYIFLNRKKFEADQIPAEVLLHEQTHASQKHSWDVILVELLHVIFWINPFIYLTKKAIKLNHEFLADQAVLKKDIDKTTYQNTLLSYLSPDSEKKYQPLANAINYSSIKKRFTVMKTHTSKKAVLLRSLLLLPLLAVLFLSFSETNLIEVEPEKFIDSDIQYDSELKIVSDIKEELKGINALTINYKGEEVFLIAETIDVHITKTGQILVKDQVVLIDDAFAVLSRYNIDLSKEEKSKIVSATIHVEDGAPQKTIDRIEEILIEYGTATINIAEWNNSIDIEKIWITIMNEDELWINDQQVQLDELASRLSSISASREFKNDLKIQIYSEETLHQNFLNKITKEIDKVGASSIKVSAEEYIISENDFLEEGIDPNTAKVHLKANKMTLDKGAENKYEKLFFRFNKKGQLSLNKKLILKDEVIKELKKNNYNYEEGLSKVYIYSKNASEKDINGLLKILRTIGIDHASIITETPTEKQIAEYNTLAKKYNTMLEKSRSIQIKMKDVERLKYIYGLMSKKQKAAAESFPDFPEPPPVPDAPKAPNEREEASNIIKNIIEEQDPYDNVHAVIYSPNKKKGAAKTILSLPPETSAPRVLKGEVSDIPPPPKEPKALKAPKVLNGEVSNIPPHPPIQETVKELEKTRRVLLETKSDLEEIEQELQQIRGEVDKQDIYGTENVRVYQHNVDNSKARSPNLMKNLESLVKRDAQFYFEGKKVSAKEGLQIVKSKKNILIETHPYVNKNPEVRIHTNQNAVSIPAPPNPPEPLSPLDHVIAMAKKNAKFYLEGKEITSDKAIEVMKKNKDINIDSRSANGKRPVVKMSTKPIRIN